MFFLDSSLLFLWLVRGGSGGRRFRRFPLLTPRRSTGRGSRFRGLGASTPGWWRGWRRWCKRLQEFQDLGTGTQFAIEQKIKSLLR